MITQLIPQRVFFWIGFIAMLIGSHDSAFATHAQSSDITYRCLGGNQFEISLSFYRDCAGVSAPNTATINISSASCGQDFNLTLNQIAGTGIEVSPICSSMSTQCTGGSYPGVQEYKYKGIVTLPVQCTDWTFSFSLCCRNASIGTIVSPGSENIYVEAQLNNLNFPCNSSPVFSNPPIPFVCVGQPYCFNNGSFDADGDSLSYTLITPRTSPTTSVTYISPYTAYQPLMSSPAITFNGGTGDMCMTPSQLEVTVFAVLVQEWRNGVIIGSVMRDIQLRTITCTNNNPYVNGINNNGQYSLTACAGTPINFSIPTFDVDPGQNVSIIWNNGITSGSFTSTGGARPTATFNWTPGNSDVSSSAHCFTVTVIDDNCPYNGSQTYSFCITVVGGVNLNTTSNQSNCNASNGSASVQVVSGTGPFTYQWIGGGTNAIQNGLAAGTYTVNVSSGSGCVSSATVTVAMGPAPGNVLMTSVNVTCYAMNNGSITANVNGGQQPYTYLWSNGGTTPTISNLAPGAYRVAVTTANGCITKDSSVITQPAAPLTYTSSHTNVNCNGGNTATATVIANGGTASYNYNWNTSPAQNSSTATNLSAGNYSVIITDNNGCVASTSVTITEPTPLVATGMVVNNISCNGLTDGYATVSASGGTGFYNYLWNTNPVQSIQSVSGLSPGNYLITVTDANNCVANSTVTISEPPPLALSVAAFPVTCNGACNGQTIVIPSGGSPSYTYQWLPDGGTGASATGLCPGTYSVTVSDANGCNAFSVLSVTQPSPVTVTTSGNTTICLGQNTTISATANGGSGNYTYNWPGVGSGSSQTVSPSVPSSFSVTAVDANGCSSNVGTLSINVTSLTASNLSVSSGKAICVGSSVTVSSNVTGNTGLVNINWNNGLGSGNGPFTVAPTISTTYVVTVSDACGNSISGSVPITVNPLPVINVSPQTLTACKQVEATFVDNSTTNLNAQYYWEFGDGYASAQVRPTHVYENSGAYTINVSVTSVYGCVNAASTTCVIKVLPTPFAEFSSEALDGTTLSPQYRFNNSSTNAGVNSWSFGDGGVSVQTSPVHTYAQQGEYTVKLVTTSNAGCIDSVIHKVEIKPVFTIYIPNAFTPDGNNINDYFTAKGDEITDFKMMIFDRWGEMIFQTTDMEKGWDGKANNGSKVAEQGVYVYKIMVKDFAEHPHSYLGHVTLLAQE